MTTITYHDGRFWKDDSPLFLVASDYQYYRDRRGNWEDRLRKLKQANVNCITFYIPWRHHLVWENGKPCHDFSGKTKDSRDVIGFMKCVQSLGLLMIAKPGPFVHSELNVGGLPDLVCPSLNESVAPARRHHGGPVTWCYDATQLPAPWEADFDAMVRHWLESVHDILVPFAHPNGSVIAIQLNDETVYCTSNDPPWNIGYEPSGVRYYHRLLADRYKDIATFNRLHGTQYEAFELIPTPKLPGNPASEPPTPVVSQLGDLLQYIDWAEYQWRYRRETYANYKRYLDLPLPYLTNYAGITPPIDENIPDQDKSVEEPIPDDYVKLYPEWWFAMNRIESDADVHHYGMISWLGVAAYDQDVFSRYINTARRARGINMEENWGFGMLYDAKSRFPIIPFYQTLVSIAGGATGYDIYCGVSTDYWDDSLDRITKKQCPTFPSDAPIDENGRCRPMYYTAKFLNDWFAENGEALLECSITTDITYLLYAPYAAVSSWIPDARYWGLADRAIPRCGYEGFEPFSKVLQQAGFSVGMIELESLSQNQSNSPKVVAIQSAFFMDESAQRTLADHVERGGWLVLSSDLPEIDLLGQPCTILRDTLKAVGIDRILYQLDNYSTNTWLPRLLMESGITPHLSHDASLRAYAHSSNTDQFIFFFTFDTVGVHDKWIEAGEHRIELQTGSKTCGVLRVRDGRIVSHLIKGTNEVEGIESEIIIRIGEQVIRGRGDFKG